MKITPNPRTELQQITAIKWLIHHIPDVDWRIKEKYSTIVEFKNKEDEFKFKIANSDLNFMTTVVVGGDQ